MRLGRVLGAVGRTLIAAGTLILLFVAYQLWGTGIHEARAQGDLEDEFEELLAPEPTTPSTPSSTAPGPTTTTLPPAPPNPAGGQPVARIVIPEIGVDKIVVEGVGVPDLKNGPGHYPGTPLPGQPGNAAIAGHRTTYGAPFNRLDELDVGDEIVTTTLQGEFHYEVSEEIVVRPHQTEVLDPTEAAVLTLTTCNPKYSARERLVIKAKLVDKPAPAPKKRPEPEPERPDVDPAGLSGERVGRGPAIMWGAIAAAVALVVWLLARKRRPGVKWAVYAAGALPFLVVLYVFFENFSRLLPANF